MRGGWFQPSPGRSSRLSTVAAMGVSPSCQGSPPAAGGSPAAPGRLSPTPPNGHASAGPRLCDTGRKPPPPEGPHKDRADQHEPAWPGKGQQGQAPPAYLSLLGLGLVALEGPFVLILHSGAGVQGCNADLERAQGRKPVGPWGTAVLPPEAGLASRGAEGQGLREPQPGPSWSR